MSQKYNNPKSRIQNKSKHQTPGDNKKQKLEYQKKHYRKLKN